MHVQVVALIKLCDIGHEEFYVRAHLKLCGGSDSQDVALVYFVNVMCVCVCVCVIQLSADEHAVARQCTTPVCNTGGWIQNSTFSISH